MFIKGIQLYHVLAEVHPLGNCEMTFFPQALRICESPFSELTFVDLIFGHENRIAASNNTCILHNRDVLLSLVVKLLLPRLVKLLLLLVLNPDPLLQELVMIHSRGLPMIHQKGPAMMRREGPIMKLNKDPVMIHKEDSVMMDGVGPTMTDREDTAMMHREQLVMMR